MKSFTEYNRDRFNEDGKARNLKENKAKRSNQKRKFRTAGFDEDSDFETFEKFSKRRT